MLVVGAGPSGADLAAGLARAGVSVGLVERLPSPDRGAFSSAALPLAALQDFGLPAEVVATRWSGWQLIGPGNQRRCWDAAHPLGAVLDFAALRRWQLDQAKAWGATVQLGCTAISTQEVGSEQQITQVRHADGGLQRVQSRWVVDASGQARALLGVSPAASADLVVGVGLEWLLEVSEHQWQHWSDRLSFCLGSDWVPQGYGWVFPMQPGVLKLGVCRLCTPQGPCSQPQPPLARLMASVIDRIGLGGSSVLDRHGGLIRSSIRRLDTHRRGRLLGLGDAVSTANLLGGEGIRHALRSSRVLQPLLIEAVRRERQTGSRADAFGALQSYRPQLKHALGWRWTLSGRLARRTWLGLHSVQADRHLERLLTGLEGVRAEDLSALLFQYRFERYGLRVVPDLLGLR